MPQINNSGQVLLIITVSLAILLGIGLSISNQTLSTILRTGQTDSLQKVTAAAEAGIERYMLYTDTQLINLVAPTNLIEKFASSNTQSDMDVADYTFNNSNSTISFPEVGINQVATLYFSNNITAPQSGRVCLKITTSNPSPNILVNAIVSNPTVQDFNALAGAGSTGTIRQSYTSDATTTNFFRTQKINITTQTVSNQCFDNLVVLRFNPLKSSIKNLTITLNSSTISNVGNVRQGFIITSIGKFISGDDKTTRKITAVKFLDSPSNVFDYTAFMDF